MNVQYYHERLGILDHRSGQVTLSAKGGTTIAMEEFPSDLFTQIELGDKVECKVGKAQCSVKDNYNKSTGRNIARGRMKDLILDVVATSETDGVKEVVLKDQSSNFYTLHLRQGAAAAFLLGYE